MLGQPFGEPAHDQVVRVYEERLSDGSEDVHPSLGRADVPDKVHLRDSFMLSYNELSFSGKIAIRGKLRGPSEIGLPRRDIEREAIDEISDGQVNDVAFRFQALDRSPPFFPFGYRDERIPDCLERGFDDDIGYEIVLSFAVHTDCLGLGLRVLAAPEV